MRSRVAVWAYLWLSKEDESRIFRFLTDNWEVPRAAVVKGMHLTVYHARRELMGVEEIAASASVTIDVSESRFMVMAPGGENPRPELQPAQRQIGIRIGKRDSAREHILAFRRQFYSYETPRVIQARTPSSDYKSAFGARHYQPHVTLLRAGSLVERDLTLLGTAFRQRFNRLHFDRFEVRIRREQTAIGTSQ